MREVRGKKTSQRKKHFNLTGWLSCSISRVQILSSNQKKQGGDCYASSKKGFPPHCFLAFPSINLRPSSGGMSHWPQSTSAPSGSQPSFLCPRIDLPASELRIWIKMEITLKLNEVWCQKEQRQHPPMTRHRTESKRAQR